MRPDSERNKRQSDQPNRSSIDPDDVRRPYDTDGLDKLPRPTDDDPPYREWWVI